MVLLRRVALMMAVGMLPLCLMGQTSTAPLVALQGGEIKFDGKFAHIHGKMPATGGSWFYNVRQRTANLYVFSLWQINEIKDRTEKDTGFYRAKSWTVEILDSGSHPERAVIFDGANDFFFWGRVASKAGRAELSISTIEGLPSSFYGPVLLQPLQ